LGLRVLGIEADIRIEVPAEYHDAGARVADRLQKRAKVSGAVDQYCDFLRSRFSPARHAFLENRPSLRVGTGLGVQCAAPLPGSVELIFSAAQWTIEEKSAGTTAASRQGSL